MAGALFGRTYSKKPATHVLQELSSNLSTFAAPSADLDLETSPPLKSNTQASNKSGDSDDLMAFDFDEGDEGSLPKKKLKRAVKRKSAKKERGPAKKGSKRPRRGRKSKSSQASTDGSSEMSFNLENSQDPSELGSVEAFINGNDDYENEEDQHIQLQLKSWEEDVLHTFPVKDLSDDYPLSQASSQNSGSQGQQKEPIFYRRNYLYNRKFPCSLQKSPAPPSKTKSRK